MCVGAHGGAPPYPPLRIKGGVVSVGFFRVCCASRRLGFATRGLSNCDRRHALFADATARTYILLLVLLVLLLRLLLHDGSQED